MPAFSTETVALAIALITSLGVCILIVRTQRWHAGLSLDANLTGKQKFHKHPVPRIGGLGLVSGMAAACAWRHWPGGPSGPAGAGVAALLACALPVFAIGLAEDLTKRVSVRMRLGLMLGGALLAWRALDAVLERLELPLVDDLLRWLPLAVAVTAIAVAGITNAINIIDGFNGLAGGTVLAILAGLAWLAWRCGDPLVLELAMLGIGATLGFLVLNYPLGLLFLGDGGAYFLGFWCAETAVLLVCRNPGISPWQVLALHAYPVIEVLYSIFRKKVLRGMSPTQPDRLHLHMLVFRRYVCRRLPPGPRPWMRNAAVAALVAPCMAAWCALVIALGARPQVAAGLLALHALAYLAVYLRLLRGSWRPVRLARSKRPARAAQARSA